MIKTTNQTVEYWERKCDDLELQLKNAEARIAYLLAKIYGRSSERQEIEGQQYLYGEGDFETVVEDIDTAIEVETHNRRKRKGKRDEDLSGLPVEQVFYELSEEMKVCPKCDSDMQVIGQNVRREVVIIPAQFKVVEHIQMVYGCRPCYRNSDSVPIIKAPLPEPVIRGSIASPSSVAYVMTQKYVNAMPLNRQENDYERNGFILSRQTMANWMIRCSEDWLEPLYEKMKKILLQRDIAHADETFMQVLKEPEKDASSKSYMWLYRTCGDMNQHIVLYEYQSSRARVHPEIFLKNFKGFLHTDGYEVYHGLHKDIIIVGCWAHLRRRLNDAWKATPKECRKGSLAEKGLWYCQRLFMLELKFKELTSEVRYEQRLLLSKPIAEEFYEWAKSSQALPKSSVGKAVNYFIGQWTYLMNVYLDGRLEFSNNRAERTIRPFTIGRKNWLFANSPKGAKASAVIYSIILTALENGLNPFQYLKYLFEQLPNVNEPIEKFLPWSNRIPSYCKIPVKQNKEHDDGNEEY